MIVLDEAIVRRLYFNDNQSIRQIASVLGVSYSTVRRAFKQYNIQPRAHSEAEYSRRISDPGIQDRRYRSRFGDTPRFADKRTVATVVRAAIYPLMGAYREQHPLCEKCKNAASSSVHHVAPLKGLLETLYGQGLSLNQIAADAARQHYMGLIALEALCDHCHQEVHKKGRQS